jgi:hypothetical protein
MEGRNYGMGFADQKVSHRISSSGLISRHSKNVSLRANTPQIAQRPLHPRRQDAHGVSLRADTSKKQERRFMDETPDPTADMRPTQTLQLLIEPQYKGVGGWLLLFCVVLTVINPLYSIGNLVLSYNKASHLFNRFPGLLGLVIIDTALILGLTSFSIYAGVRLWRVKSGAVQTTKRLLWCVLAYNGTAAVMPFLTGHPAKNNSAMILLVIKHTFRGFMFFAVWYSYLKYSKRVKATFGQ